MKQSGICPKCQTAAVIQIKAFKNTSTFNRVQLSKWGMHVAFYDTFICHECGYMEQYVDLDDKNWQKWLVKKAEEDAMDSDFV